MSVAAHADTIASLHQSGWTYAELADAFGTTRSAVSGALYRLRTPPTERKRAKRKSAGQRGARPGEQNHNAKITEADVREIRRRWDAGETAASIAEDFGLSSVGAWFVCTRKNWKHVV